LQRPKKRVQSKWKGVSACMNKSNVVAALVMFATCALVIVIIILFTRSSYATAAKAASKLFDTLLGDGGPTVPEAALPVPGFRYMGTGGRVQNLRAMWWAGLPSERAHPTYENMVGQSDAATIFSSDWLWGTPDGSGALQWLGSETYVGSNTNYSAFCPLGSVVTGVRTFKNSTSGPLATAAVPMCTSVFGFPGVSNVEGTLIADNEPTVNIDTSTMTVGGTYYGASGYLTANNFLRGDDRQWYGNMLADQSLRGDNRNPPAFYWEGITFTSNQCNQVDTGGFGQHPWKPSGANNGDGENETYWFEFTLLYYKVLDLEGAPPHEMVIQIPSYQWTGRKTDNLTNTWQYTNTQKPLIPTLLEFDATRPVTVNYGNGDTDMMGMAVKAGSWKLMAGSPNTPNSSCGTLGNCPRPTPGGPETWDCGQQTVPVLFSLYSQVNNQYSISMCYGCAINNIIMQLNSGPFYPTNYMVSLDTAPVANILPTLATWADAAKLTVIDPTCTGVMTASDDSGNPIDVSNVNDKAKTEFESWCGTRAKKLCATLAKDDPYCACLNATPIAGVDQALGTPFTMHCLSDGNCMKSSPLTTWMDFDTADVSLCPTLKIQICEFLAKLDATAIVITDTRFKCTDIDDTCPECDAGGGPCKAVDTVGGLTACRPRQPDGTCGDGFIACTNSNGADQGVTQDEIIYIAAGFAVVTVILSVLAYKHASAASAASSS
jgi:hypothetical protein